jgi:hypothetical protein
MGIGLGSLVFIVFLIMKLAGIGMVATWSWWWVTAPLWIGGVVTLIMMLVAGAFAVVIAAKR